MKLLYKSSIYFTITTFIVLLLGGISIYFILQAIIHEEVDDWLLEKRIITLLELEKIGSFESFSIPSDKSIIISQPVKESGAFQLIFSDTLLATPFDEELIPFRKMEFFATINNETRKITVFRSLIESDEIIEGITYSLFLIFFIIILAIVILNYFGMNRLWNPFRTILQQIQQFDFRSRHRFEPIRTDITEFNELSNELIKMTDKLIHDYFSLKEFSENASHEMQTPLAIIQAKLELLFQQHGCEEERLKALKAAYEAANRLSRLHYELNLLSRIENKEFKEQSAVHLKSLLENNLENFSDIIEMKNIQLQLDINANPVIQGSSFLLEVMLSNLLGNAIKHNIPNGTITISLTDNSIIISNSGAVPNFPPEILFERFRKGKPTSDSIGLGLSIVKQICILHDITIEYTFQKNQHIIKLNF